MSGCSPAPVGVEIWDPYEARNRRVHEFNVGFDRDLLRPVAVTVAKAPDFTTRPVSNFADNVGLPGMVVNGLLQGDIGGAATNTMRFLINSTIGIAGLLDPAGVIGLTEESTDFGETLAVWGVPEGAYLELPVRGPSTERDAVGKIVDLFIDPLKYYGSDKLTAYAAGATVADTVIDRGRFAQTIDSLLYDSADGYAQARLLYLQNRRFQLGEAAGDTYVDPYADPYSGQ
jgi:phospholipid-binding lipoprotein MlaA